MWYEAGDDMYGLVARDQRLVSIAQDLLQKDIYLYSHKMTVKEPLQGGAWEWHQDYGYWYENKCLAPEMLSIWVALDKSVRENGCLQVLPGSHALGRINHVRVDGQSSADPEYLAAALDRFELAYMEMEPGDALVFHCNLLHRSDANTSNTPRWGYIASYNTVANIPFRQVRDYGHSLDLRPVPAGSFVERRTVSSGT
jgi:ectoine hydroxylase-related dioxygenase (phytanoyl-CoA dioxygenase family)